MKADKSKIYTQILDVNIKTLLNADLSHISYVICPYVGFNMAHKVCLSLFTIYLTWFLMFQFLTLAKKKQWLKTKDAKLVMISGMIEIATYTNSRFECTTFEALTCISANDTKVLFYSKNVACFSIFQYGFLIFILV